MISDDIGGVDSRSGQYKRGSTTFLIDEVKKVKEATTLAKSVKAVVNTLFPEWPLYAEAAISSPANIIL
jgi:hypothetical protein